MTTDEINKIIINPHFVLLTKKRFKIKVIMVTLTMLVFLIIQSLWAFYPEIVNLRVPDNSSISLAIWLTVVMIFTAISLAAYYTLVSGKQLDELSEKLIRDLNHEK